MPSYGPQFYVQPLPGAYDPNSATHMDMWVVYRWFPGDGMSIPWQMAYCNNQHDALTIAALLTATVADSAPEDSATETEMTS